MMPSSRDYIRLKLVLAGPNSCSRLGSRPPVEIVYGIRLDDAGRLAFPGGIYTAHSTLSDCLHYTLGYKCVVGGRAIPVSHEGVMIVGCHVGQGVKTKEPAPGSTTAACIDRILRCWRRASWCPNSAL